MNKYRLYSIYEICQDLMHCGVKALFFITGMLVSGETAWTMSCVERVRIQFQSSCATGWTQPRYLPNFTVLLNAKIELYFVLTEAVHEETKCWLSNGRMVANF